MIRVLAALLMLTACGEPLGQTDETKITVALVEGTEATWRLETARTPEAKAKGLQHRRDLGTSVGMLFVLDEDDPRAVWMKDTPVPLDALFLDASGEVLAIREDLMPFDETIVDCGCDAAYIIELPAGEAGAMSIGVGAKVNLRKGA